MKPIKRNITDFYNTDFKEYALYTIHSRALPGLLDGLKPVHRKILWTANKKAKNKAIKTVSLSGYVIAESDYKHGDMSVLDSIIKMASSWRNNISLLDGIGNFGWRMVPSAGAPRYTKVKLASDFFDWFSDFNALKYTKGDDENYYEPDCYYSNVPWFLVNGFRGIATGYSFFCHPRDPKNLVKFMTSLLDGKVPDESLLDVDYPEYEGIIDDGYSVGKWVQKTKKKIVIESLPVEYNVDTYSSKLVKLVEKGVIKDFHKTLADGEPPFLVELKEPLRNPEKTLGLRRKLTGETFVFIHNNKLISFNDIWGAVGTFADERLKIAGIGLKQSMVSREELIERINTKIKFIQAVRRRSKDELTNDNLKAIIKNLGRPDMTESLLSMRISKLTEESIEIWEDQVSSLSSELKKLGKTTPTQWLRYNILNKPLS